MPKIFWTRKEQNELIDSAAVLIHTGAASGLLDALRKCQTVIPPERRRTFTTITGVPWFTDGVRARLGELHEAPEPPAPEPLPEPSDALLDGIADFLARLVRHPKIRAVLHDALAEPRVEQSPSVTAQVHYLTPKRTPKVLIVGLLGMQAETIKQHFSDAFDLRFKGSEDRAKEVKAAARSADHTIGMVGFLSHSQEEALRTCGGSFHRISNGVSALKVLLNQLKEAA